MGIFGATKQTFVASVAYNMAGDEENRVDFLKTTVVGSVITNRNTSITDLLQGTYLNGPGIKMRSFHRWARNPANYGLLGIPTANIAGTNVDYDMNVVRNALPFEADVQTSVTAIDYGKVDFSFWADQWVMINYPDRVGTAYVAQYNVATDTVTITWTDATTSTFTPTGVDKTGTYFYVTYGRKNAEKILPPRMWIYQVGTGSIPMDQIHQGNPFDGEFLPFIPVRYKNQFLSPTYQPAAYEIAKKAYKKATGQKFSKLVAKIADNEDLEDIDNAYIVFGVSLNCIDNSARKYLFEFFRNMMSYQQYSYASVESYDSLLSAYLTDNANYSTIRRDYFTITAVGDRGDTADPGYTEFPPEPVGAPVTMIEIKSSGSFAAGLHIVMRWRSLRQLTGAGLAKPEAKVGEVWFTIMDEELNDNSGIVNQTGDLQTIYGNTSRISITHQKSATEWEKLEIIGLVHENIIHNGEKVTIGAVEALNDTDESGFVVPIHYNTFREMSLIESTQMMTAGSFIIFNCYKVVKQKWYQTTVFKIILFVVIIAITVATAGAAAPGLLGTAGAVGASLGFAAGTLVATIVGAIANAIAAMIVAQLITMGATALFGDKIGAIIAVIATTIAMSVGSSLSAGQTLASSWGNMMSASNLINLSSAVGKGVAGYLQASAMETMGKTDDLMKQYELDSAKYTKMFLDEFGYGRFGFDATLLTDAGKVNYESMDSFLSRTLMTGSDIAEMTNDMLNNMPSYTLALNTSGR